MNSNANKIGQNQVNSGNMNSHHVCLNNQVNNDMNTNANQVGQNNQENNGIMNTNANNICQNQVKWYYE